MKHLRIAGVTISLLLLLPAAISAMGVFDDVSTQYPFKDEIESLTRAGVLHGNPDGKFYPDRSVNRAEFLKMLYAATGRTPKSAGGCFPDVVRASWYEPYVCDAALKENGFVRGYADGSFKPASPVSRTEAIKMLLVVFGLRTPEMTSALDKDIIKFVDTSSSAWYTKYLNAAYIHGILPITGQTGVRFYPEKELTRGEAAAYIFNGLRALEVQRAQVQAQSSSSSSFQSFDIVKNVVFPFVDADQFSMKRPVAYLFDLKEQTVVSATITVTGAVSSDVSCRLYMLDQDGFTSEYYLGVQHTGKCRIFAAVNAGKYQIQVQPSIANVPYTIEAKAGVSDGNDGFSDALQLQSGVARTGMLEPSDLYDWYKFSIPGDVPLSAKVEVGASEKIECVIYTPSSVDQFGFTGPECNKTYQFQPSDQPYIIGIGRRANDAGDTIPYTVKWQ
jgi:hypothetical protein